MPGSDVHQHIVHTWNIKHLGFSSICLSCTTASPPRFLDHTYGFGGRYSLLLVLQQQPAVRANINPDRSTQDVVKQLCQLSPIPELITVSDSIYLNSGEEYTSTAHHLQHLHCQAKQWKPLSPYGAQHSTGELSSQDADISQLPCAPVVCEL